MEDAWKILSDFNETKKESLHNCTLELNQEQQRAFDVINSGQSVFLTGPSGTGKSRTLMSVIQWAHNKKTIGTTATTGASAILIGGQTINSYLGIGVGTRSAKQMADVVFLKNKRVLNRILALDILIIDEISMMDDELFDKISEFLSIIRANESPFGGIQLILCGDFSQNCPVNGKYCFLSKTWTQLGIKNIILHTFIRHQDDPEFQSVLASLRIGKVTKSVLNRLEQLRHTSFPEGIEPTTLYGKNVDVNAINDMHFKKLVENGAKCETFITTYTGHSKSWAQCCKVPEILDICSGSQVMLTWNVSPDDGLVNGTRGVIVDFTPIYGYPIMQVNGSKKKVSIEPITVKDTDLPMNTFTFIPLKLAWALTIAKSQGCTLDYCIIDLSSWAYGQAYTALSRVRSLKNVKLIGEIKAEYFRASPDVIRFYAYINKT